MMSRTGRPPTGCRATSVPDSPANQIGAAPWSILAAGFSARMIDGEPGARPRDSNQPC